MSDPERPPEAARPSDGGSPPAVPDGDLARPARDADAVERFARRIELILRDPMVSARVAAAGITVRIDLEGAADRSVTLLFDRQPPTVERGVATAHPTVRLVLAPAALDRLLSEASHLPMAILAGDVVFEGAVRKLLRVMPILRGGALGLSDEEMGPDR
jgi:hypothetical protein